MESDRSKEPIVASRASPRREFRPEDQTFLSAPFFPVLLGIRHPPPCRPSTSPSRPVLKSVRLATHRCVRSLPHTPDDLSGFLPKRRAFTIHGEDKTELGVVPIMYMRDLMKDG